MPMGMLESFAMFLEKGSEHIRYDNDNFLALDDLETAKTVERD